MRHEHETSNQNDRLHERYGDLLENRDDDDLMRLISDLDTLYAQAEPPAFLARTMEQAIQAQAQREHTSPSAHRAKGTGNAMPRQFHPTPAPHLASPSRKRVQTFAASAAAIVIVALMVGLLHALASSRSASQQGTTLLTQRGGLQIQLAASWYCPAGEQPCHTSCPAGGCKTSDEIPFTLDTLNQRLSNAFPGSGAVAQRNGNSGIVIDLPGAKDDNQLRPLLTPGNLAIVDAGSALFPLGKDISQQMCHFSCQPGQYHVLFTGQQIDPASLAARTDPQSGQPIVTFAFYSDTRAQFSQYTRAHIGQPLTITLDGKVIESATIQSEIDGAAQIAGFDILSQAQDLVTVLKSGPLSLSLRIVSEQLIKPHGAACATATSTPAPQQTPTPGATPSPTEPATPTPPSPSTATPGAAYTAATPTAYGSAATSVSASAACSTPTPASGISTPTATAAASTPTQAPGPTPIPTATPQSR